VEILSVNEKTIFEKYVETIDIFV